MSVTGVALTYEKQMLEWADRRAASVVPGPAHLAPEQLLWTAATAMPGKAPIGLTLRADASSSRSRLKGMPRCSWIRTGRADRRTAGADSQLLPHHDLVASLPRARCTAAPRGRRSPAPPISVLFLVVSGLYLWFPRAWNWIQFRNVLWFRRGAGKGA